MICRKFTTRMEFNCILFFIITKFKKIIIPELNTGQLLKLVREAFLVDARGINKVSGEPFTAQELTDKIEEKINE